MTLRKQIIVVAMWLGSMFATAMVGLYAQAPLPPREPRLPGSLPPAAAEVISGSDLGFRIDSRKGNTPVGRLVIRINGQWVEVEESAGLKRLTAR
jgi:hypothetical protein